VAPTPVRVAICGEPGSEVMKWRCEGDGSRGWGWTPRDAVAKWWGYWDEEDRDWREIVEPGQLFAHEQVAAERERCAGHALAHEQWAREVTAGARGLLLRAVPGEASALVRAIRSGEEPLHV
jgi:hypothetical protein